MKKTALILPLLSLLPFEALAETPEARGLAIAEEADRRDNGWGDSRVDLRMILRNRQGDTAEREISVSTLEVEGDGDERYAVPSASQLLQVIRSRQGGAAPRSSPACRRAVHRLRGDAHGESPGAPVFLPSAPNPFSVPSAPRSTPTRPMTFTPR